MLGPTSYIFISKEVPDSRDPPSRSVRSIVILVANVYVHTGGVWNDYSRIRTARARVHGWVGTEKLHRRRVHREATECIVFMGRGVAYRKTEETDLLRSKRGSC